ncbi:MAG: hypothetical protein F4109_00800 [Gammaproteobacteria bacterium]|nr:hypothetical protein [Gammaproteobacteria bacterium]MYD01028.1 hypothetical protein [Gammaproteobacteria bacterium]MYI23964.1 hypothetical protein [Gammaproteobacteria bacterium]
MMKRWFDLYVGVGGTYRHLMIRLPKRLVNRAELERVLGGTKIVEAIESRDNLILDIFCEFEPRNYEDWDDGKGWMGVLAPLRRDLLSGDMRLAYVLWLWEVEHGRIAESNTEPLPGIGPLTGGLEALAEFFQIDGDLLCAAAEMPDIPTAETRSGNAMQAALEAIPHAEKTRLLQRVAESDPHVAAELIRLIKESAEKQTPDQLRPVGELWARVEAIRMARHAEAAERREKERRERERFDEKMRNSRLNQLRGREPETWLEIEALAEKRTYTSYDRAAQLIFDLHALAEKDNDQAEFFNRLKGLRTRHHRKKRFIERLAKLDQ